MHRLFSICCLLIALLIPGTTMAASTIVHPNAYGFAFTAIDGQPLPFDSFKGKAVLVVNTASMCGFTPQYKGLQALWETYRDKGLVVLGVPSGDFGGQEFDSEAKIQEFCAVNFAIDFPMTTKQTVKGRDAHPFFRWAADQKGEPRWNFHKYLVDSRGVLVGAFGSNTTPDSPDLRTAVEAALPR